MLPDSVSSTSDARAGVPRFLGRSGERAGATFSADGNRRVQGRHGLCGRHRQQSNSSVHIRWPVLMAIRAIWRSCGRVSPSDGSRPGQQRSSIRCRAGGDRVQIFTPKGEVVRTIRGDDTPAGSFDGAAGVLVAPNGDFYVADFYNDRVVRFGPSGAYHSVLGKPGRVLP